MAVRCSLLLWAVLLASPPEAPAVAPQTNSVVVFVDGVAAPAHGDVVVRLYRSAEGFPDDRRRAYREVRVGAVRSAVTVIARDVPVGRVAVVAFHDADGDGRLRYSPEGAPLDGVAASADPRLAGARPGASGVRRPSWRSAAFEHRGERASLVRLTLRYP